MGGCMMHLWFELKKYIFRILQTKSVIFFLWGRLMAMSCKKAEI